MKRYLWPLAVCAVIATVLYWWFAPAQVLKRRSRELLEVVSLESGSGKPGRQMAVYGLNALLAAEVELDNPDIGEANGTFPRGELESAFSWLGEQAIQTRFELEKFQTVQVAGNRADVDLTLNALVELPRSRPVDGHYQVTLSWQHDKQDGWRLARARWHKAMP